MAETRECRFSGMSAQPPLPASFLITGDEEGPAINGTEKLLRWAYEKGERFDHFLVGEPTSWHVLGDTIKIGRRGSLNGTLARIRDTAPVICRGFVIFEVRHAKRAKGDRRLATVPRRVAPHTSSSLYAGPDFVEVLTKCPSPISLAWFPPIPSFVTSAPDLAA
jgi:hypothetical protein